MQVALLFHHESNIAGSETYILKIKTSQIRTSARLMKRNQSYKYTNDFKA